MPTQPDTLSNLEAERSVLGSAFLQPKALEWAIANVPPRAYWMPAHQEIAEALVVLHGQGTPVEMLTVKNQLAAARKLDEVGGENYVIQVAEAVPSAANVEHYGRIVLEFAGRRAAVSRANKIHKIAHDEKDYSKVLNALKHLDRGLWDPATSKTIEGLSDLVTFNGTFKSVDVDYLIEPYMPKGKTILFDADGGTGKTSMLLGLAATLSNGMCHFGKLHGGPVRTLYLYQDADKEEEYETVYRGNGGREGWISYYRTPRQLTSDFADEIIQTAKEGEYGFIVLDPFFYYLLGMMKDTNGAMEAIPACREVNRIASTVNATVCAVRHTSKGQVGKSASELGMGTVQFRNSFRGQLVARWHPEEKGVVVVSDEKGSILVPRGDSFSFRRVGLEIQYIQGQRNPFDTTLTSSTSIRAWLLQEVPHATWMDSSTLEAKAKDAGFDPKSGTFRREKQSVCRSQKFGQVWHTILKDNFAPTETEAYDPYTDV